jgi:hypothetical protein
MMHGRNLLTCFILLFVIEVASAYTVILKNGKKVEGTYLEENDSQIVVRDKDGIVLTFRKTTLDLDAMSGVNPQTPQEQKPEAASTQDSAQTKPADPKPSDTKSTQKPTKVFTNEDVKDLPELSVAGSEQPQEIAEEEAGPEESVQDEPDAYGVEAEMYWKDQTRKISNRLYEAEDNYTRVQKECDDAKEAFAWYALNGYWGGGFAPYDPAYVCDQANQAKAVYDDWKSRFEEFQERARREGALPGWIDPERLDH